MVFIHTQYVFYQIRPGVYEAIRSHRFTNHVKKHKLWFLYIQNMFFYQIRPGVYEAIRSHLDGSCKKTIIYVFLHKKCPFYKIRPGVYEALRFRMA